MSVGKVINRLVTAVVCAALSVCVVLMLWVMFNSAVTLVEAVLGSDSAPRTCYTVTDERGGIYRTDSPVQAMEVVAGMPAVRWEDNGEVIYLFRPLSVTYNADLCETGQNIKAVEAQR